MVKFILNKRFLNVKETAQYLNLSEDTIRSWIKKGEIPCSSFGRTVRFDIFKLEPWLKQKERWHSTKLKVEENLFCVTIGTSENEQKINLNT